MNRLLTPASSCFVVSLLSCCWNSRNPSQARRKTLARTMRWGGNNSYYVRRRAIWKEMSAKISALVKISSIILRRYICLLLCLSPKCNNGENKFALRWNETRGWYLFVFVARPSRLRSALPCLTSPAISPSPLPTPHVLPWRGSLSSILSLFRASTGSHGRATSRHSISPRWRSGRRGGPPPPAGRGGRRWPESRAELQSSIRINQAAPPLNPEIIVSVITPGVSVCR